MLTFLVPRISRFEHLFIYLHIYSVEKRDNNMPPKRFNRRGPLNTKSKAVKRRVNRMGPKGQIAMTFGRANRIYNNTFRRLFNWGQDVMLSSKEQYFSHWASLKTAIATGIVTEYSTIFDQYRIVSFQVKWIPTLQTNVVFPGSPSAIVLNPSPPYGAYDFDGLDASILTFKAFQELASFTTFNPSRPCQMRVKPKALTWMEGEGTSGNAGLTNPWLDIKFPDIKHYGMVWCIGPGATPGSTVPTEVIRRFVLTAMIEFRGAR